jgi:DNA-3-methyladenine glycosylase I
VPPSVYAPPASRSKRWSAHAPRPLERPPASWADVPATVPETVALARDLKRRCFRFVGPTTLYALMQACGLVDDHLAGCPARPAVEVARRAAGLAQAGSER